jgi:hypothetical protein
MISGMQRGGVMIKKFLLLFVFTAFFASCLSTTDTMDPVDTFNDTIYVYDTTIVFDTVHVTDTIFRIDTVRVIDTNATISPFAHFASSVTVTQDGSVMVIQSNGIPNHNSPYFATSDSRYEAYNGTNSAFAKNPNTIQSQSLTFRIPANPAPATAHQSTALGPIGVALNGVPLYNQFAGPNQPLTNEINSFDQYNGHPQQQGQYHYHFEPLYITAQGGKATLIGFLLDGYPVYGPNENGAPVLETSLDVYHGHTTATSEYPDGIYHYHATSTSPYINGGQFYGTPGTVTQ